jgi:S-adenosylmethionine-diacylglycerol 3-amino-3-carboxypropyl transferase
MLCSGEMSPSVKPPAASEVRRASFFDGVGYSSVWEDERVVDEWLRPRQGERALSITSGGCFTLQLLLHDVAEVVSVDFNPHQTELLALKAAAVRSLEEPELWALLGLRDGGDRAALYGRVRGALDPASRGYWDARPGLIARGAGLAGRQDRYLHAVGRVVTLLQGRRRVGRLLDATGGDVQRRFYDEEWSGPVWRAVCGLVFSRFVLDRAFDPAHFAFAREGSPSQRFRREVERFLREVPVRDNFYLHYLFRRTYADDERCPAWLRRGAPARLRARLDRLVPVTGDLERWIAAAPDASVDVFNLSNAFDWMSPERFEWFLGELVRVARPGARAYWTSNLVNVRREPPPGRFPQLRVDVERGRELDRRCRTPGYSGCVVAEVRK